MRSLACGVSTSSFVSEDCLFPVSLTAQVFASVSPAGTLLVGPPIFFFLKKFLLYTPVDKWTNVQIDARGVLAKRAQ